MKLVIEYNHKITIQFIKWLIKIIKQLYLSKLDIRKLKVIETYINENNIFELDHKINISQIILQVLNNIIYVKQERFYHIMINPNTVVSGTSIKLIEFYKLIEYGNGEINGYPLLSSILYEIKDNIKQYRKRYEIENNLLL